MEASVAIRNEFDLFCKTNWRFMENAGGSQIPRIVSNAIKDYMDNFYVQVGASYDLSVEATNIVKQAHNLMSEFFNSSDCGEIVFGPSTSQLIYNLAICYSRVLNPGDEIIIATSGHEANIGPWVDIAKDKNLVLKICPPEKDDNGNILTISETKFKELLSDKTKLVALPHVNNLLGEIVDVKKFTNLAHQVGAKVIVDGVAYAPHRVIDVKDWDVDWYVCSVYKIYGPHMAVMFGKTERFSELTGLNWFFVGNSNVTYKFELGCISHESCAGVVALLNYFKKILEIFNVPYEGLSTRKIIEECFTLFTKLEHPLQHKLLTFLLSKPKVRLFGSYCCDNSFRVPTISFTHSEVSSKDICSELHKAMIACRNGHMYAYRLVEFYNVDLNDGVVRLSLLHYNTEEEVDYLISILDKIL